MISKDIIKKKFDAAVIKYAQTFQILRIDPDFCRQMYMLMWDEFPHVITLSTDGCYLNNAIDDYLAGNNSDGDEYSNDKNPHFCTFENISVQSTLNNIIKTFKKNILVYRNEDYPIIVGDHMIIFMQVTDNSSDLYIIQNHEYLTAELANCIIEKDTEDCADYTYIWNDMGNIEEASLQIKDIDIENIDLETNYNDDLPHEEITAFLKSNESGMVILHGDPGTGKSDYIKYLIDEIRGRHFIIIDSEDVQYFTNTMFTQIFLNSKDNVIVIEDNAVTKNSTNKAEQLKTLLGIDGKILGSNMSCKFICIFNDIAYNYTKNKVQSNKIKIDYEFKSLSPEKTKILCDLYDVKLTDENTSLPLSKIIKGNMPEEDDYDKNVNKHKIGFGK